MLKKIVVIGVTAAGKSSFARRLEQKAHLPLIHIDAVMWKPGWQYVGDAETAAKLDEITSESEWLLEGYLVDEARPLVLERAEQIIFLDYSPLVSAFRYLKRWFKHRKHPRPELPGSPEKFSFKFLELAWVRGEVLSFDKILDVPEYKKKAVILKSPKEAEKFLQQI